MKPFRSSFTRLALAGAAALALLSSAFATDYYLTRDGDGARDGTSWSNAYPQSQLQSALDALQPGDALLVGSGTYSVSPFTINGSGAAGSPKSLRGVDTGDGLPLFLGTYDIRTDAKSNFINFPGAADFWEIRNLRFKNQPFAINMTASGTTDTLRTHIVFENLHFDTVEDAIRIRNASHILVKDCTVIRHAKKAFRVGDYCSFVTFQRCATDCTGGDPSFPARSIPNGFACDDTDGLPIIHDITFVDCIARNNGYAQPSDDYWQGDGFSSERGAYNLTYLRCKAYDNHDGGFDNKATNITYRDCVSAGNSRGFRHWGPGGQMFNCVAAYNVKWGGNSGAYGLWISRNDGQLMVDFSTFHHNSTPQIVVESGGTASLTVNNSILSAPTSTATFVTGSVALLNTATYRPGEGTDPVFAAASTWRGEPLDAMDSQTYGTTKGYSSTRVDEAPNTPPALAIAASTTSGVAPLAVDFTAVAADSDGLIIGYLWTFGDGQISTEPDPSVVYSVPGTYTVTCTASDNRGANASASIVITAAVPTVPVAMRIESGSSTAFTDGTGQVWNADHSFGSGGGIADRGAIEIAGTSDDRLYQTERWGVSNYAVLLANGTYQVRLHFAETYSGITAPGQRVFTVTAEDATPAGWSNIDVFAETGARNTALVKSGTIAVHDNVLNLVFTGLVDNPMINGIEILPASSGDLPPAPPTGLVVSNVTASSLTLEWSPATDDVGVAGYDVFLDGTFVGATAGTSLPITGLASYTRYQLTVRTRDTAGNRSPFSPPLVGKTLADESSGRDLIVDNADRFGVELTGAWVASSYYAGFHGTNYLHDNKAGKGAKSVLFTPDLPSGGTFAVYLRWPTYANNSARVPVDINHAGGTTTVVVNQRATGSTWFSLGTYVLAAGTSNSVRIRTGDTGDYYVMADAVRFVRETADTEPPSPPAGVAASGVTTSGFALSWTASTDNVGVTAYEVSLDGAVVATPAVNSASVAGLSPGTSYAVTVRARDAAGNWSPASAPLSVTTAPVSGGGAGSVISINLTDAANSLAPADVVGAVPVPNWSNSTTNNQQLANVPDSTGVATTADITFNNTAFAYNNNTAVLADPLTDDAKMMRSQRGLSNSSSMSVFAAQVPYASYDVYVYWGGRTASESVPTTMTVNFQLNNGASWVTSQTKYIRDNNRAWDGTYDESIATTAAEATDGTEYVVFRGVTASTFRVAITASTRTGISGLQIVDRSVPPPPTITSAPSANGTYGAPFQYHITANGHPASFAASDLPAGLAFDPITGAITGIPAVTGTFTLTLSATNPSGTTSAPLVLTLAPASQTITFDPPAAKTFGDAPFTLSASASSGLPVAFAVTSGSAEVSGDVVTITGAGTVVLTASQPGGANFLPAVPVSVSLTVAQAPQTITFTNPGAKTFGDAPVTLAAQTTSGLPVAYTLTGGPATLAGHVVTLTGAGAVHITAAQPGNDNFLAAESVSVSFEVAPAPAELALERLWQLYDGESKPVAVVTTPADLPVRITYNGSATPPVYPGSYAVAVDIDSPDYAGSASDTLVIAAGIVVRHAPVLNGRVEGSMQVLSAEPVTLNDGAVVSGDLLTPGTPAVQRNGQPNFGGAIDGPGNAQPSSFTITLNGNSTLRHLVRRIDAVALPTVSAPPAPTGTRNVALNNATQSAGDFATLRNLTLNGNAGLRAIPPGTYGTFIANGGGGFILGVAGATEPAVYHLQDLTLNGNAQVQVVGPVVLTLASGVTLNGRIGAAGEPELLLLRIASGGLTLNGGAALDGFVDAPNGAVIINGNSTLTGGVASDRLIVNGGGLLIQEAP